MTLSIGTRPRAMDLFAGAGGMTLGMRAAGVRTAVAVEREAMRCETFARHSPGTALIQADVREVGFERWAGEFDVVYGGPPCQPFSTGGLQRAHEDERDMIPAFLRAVESIRPRAFVMENVPGLASGARSFYLSRVIAQTQALGYFVSAAVLNAADYGVPQIRKRLFVVGMLEREYVFPSASHGLDRPRPHVRVCDALPSPERPIGEPNGSAVTFAKSPDLRPSAYDGHIFNGGGRPIHPERPCHTILASAGGNKTHFFDLEGRVPAYHAHLAGGGAPAVGALAGARRLTVEESASLQSFPPEIAFAGSRSARYAQVGDAVPPLLARAIGEALVAQLAGGRPALVAASRDQPLLFEHGRA